MQHHSEYDQFKTSPLAIAKTAILTSRCEKMHQVGFIAASFAANYKLLFRP